MNGYIIYKCQICGKSTILLSNEVDHSEQASRYITCGHHGSHKDLVVVGKYAGIKECMRQRKYKRVNGRVQQEQ